ncbi:hypothetical protein BS50DRAFT_619143 [Corynespora cassiicola Philippines]|uniref:Fungal N-terminal domain-containing protein n=1 Tax=Corynespora cassiicola Philippines TaxID=1448308 RepID=A0A2T2NXW1_CORCC|nr:hypothetical protein BS50DRAFT_619143 [Corynespora cassiicola Philippines]
MAEPLSLAASAITVAQTAANLSLALFKVAHTFKHAPAQISDIASEISTVSNTFTVLSDAIRSMKHQCKPPLFREIQTTLERFHKIEAQLIKLTEKSSKLQRLRWFFDGPRAENLLKKVEGIKSALTLIVSVLSCTKEQLISESSAHGENSPGQQQQRESNRYRRVVECAVQAARNTVERVEMQDRDFPTEKRRDYNHKLQVWEANSHDTATWLYYLVFYPDGTSTQASQASDKSKQLPDRKARVDDYDSDNPDPSLVTVKGEESRLGELDECRDLIVWDGTTEPSFVTDRLLRAWTWLSEQQIKATRTHFSPGKEEEWGEKLTERIKQYERTKETQSLAHSPYRESDSDEDEYEDTSDSEYTSAAEESTLGEWGSQVETEPGTFHHKNPYAGQEQGHIRLGGKSVSSGHPPRAPNPFELPLRPNPFSFTPPDQNVLEQPLPTTLPPPYHRRPTHPPNPSFVGSAKPPDSRQPMKFSGPTIAPPQPAAPLASISPIPAAAHTPTPLPVQSPPISDASKGKLLEEMVKLEAILKSGGVRKESAPRAEANISLPSMSGETPIMERLESLLMEQKSKDTSAERYQRFARLESLLLKQGEDDIRRYEKLVAEQRVEKAISDANATLEAEKANRLIEEQIRHAKEAKQEAEKTLNFVQEQAARRKRAEDEARLLNERKKSEEAHFNKMDAFDQRLDTITSKLEELGNSRRIEAPPMPLRRTCFSEGGRRIEVSEFAPDMLDPIAMSERAHQGSSRDASMGFDFALSRNPVDSRSRSHGSFQRHGRLQGSYGSLPSLNPFKRIGDATPSQKMILLPSKLDRSSTKTSEMTSLLARCGITSHFEDTSYESNRALMHLDRSSEDLVRSTIFWESPIVSLGSELFETLKFKGWRPFYSRNSEFGVTYFLGHQPIQVFFFDPKYRPQLTASTSNTQSERIHIAQALIEKDALAELELHATETTYGGYSLDGQLTAIKLAHTFQDDIENLINRSFMIRETRLRLRHRHRPCIPHKAPMWSTDVPDTRPSITARRPSTVATVVTETEEESEASLPQTASTMPSSRAFREESSMFGDDECETPLTSPVPGSTRRDSFSDSRINDSSMCETRKKEGVKSQRAERSTSTTSGRMNKGPLRLRPTKVKSHVD